ncbi:AB hydrolase-1 domain-containing protein [Citrus sinensis]|uniref:AB hydrolase-1 domain-containing protein n=1 Tax=Citrus sinensis TaxID=2711 RepID=A0ACB8M8W3_CITSI|nr:AB hydrolase-1 domain-containing protein [Citrus sinensis]
MSVWMVRDRTPSFIIPITTLRIGNGNGDVKGLRLPLLSNKSWQFQLQFQQRNKEKKKRQNVTISYTNSSSGGDSASAALELEVNEIRESCKIWKWKGQYSINYLVSSTPNSHPNSPPLLLVHGFGASIPHWRSYTVYAIDLLGFGASDKPAGYSYTMEGWAQLILDFLDEVVKKPTVLIGNSVGSVIAASGPPGPNPVQLMPSISIPVLVLWGDEDPFTPLGGPVGKYFSSLPSKLSNVKLIVLDGVGHCPHDDSPELVHEKLLLWLAETFNF